MWFRVFGSSPTEPSPAAFLECLHNQGYEVPARFRGDDHGWFRVEFMIGGEEEPLELERYLATEEGIRSELNTWAAWLESAEQCPHAVPLMQRIIGTAQVFAVELPEEFDQGRGPPLCEAICRFLAEATGGVYQIDGQGFFTSDGRLLVKEH
jgi:hypothetical protein